MNRRSFLAGLLGTVITPALPTRHVNLMSDSTSEWRYVTTIATNPLLEGSIGSFDGLTFHTMLRARDILATKAIRPVNGYYVVTLTDGMLDELMRPLTIIERLEMRVREMLGLDG